MFKKFNLSPKNASSTLAAVSYNRKTKQTFHQHGKQNKKVQIILFAKLCRHLDCFFHQKVLFKCKLSSCDIIVCLSLVKTSQSNYFGEELTPTAARVRTVKCQIKVTPATSIKLSKHGCCQNPKKLWKSWQF